MEHEKGRNGTSPFDIYSLQSLSYHIQCELNYGLKVVNLVYIGAAYHGSFTTISCPTPSALSRLLEPSLHIPFKHSCPPSSLADVECELAAYSTVAWFLRFRVFYDGLLYDRLLFDGLYDGLYDGVFDNLPIFSDTRIVPFLIVVAWFRWGRIRH